MREIEIAGRKLGDGHPPFIVGEVGVNHNGDLATAIQMCEVAKAAGCDMVKFGVFKADEFCNPEHDITYWHEKKQVTEREIDMFRRCELPDSAWHAIKKHCDHIGIIFFATPQNETDLQLLLKVGVPCVKIGSDDLTNLSLIDTAASTGLPLILSTGMADWQDTAAAIITVGRECVLCVCTSEYPCPPSNANVARIEKLKIALQATPIGFSDHTYGTRAAVIATTLGAAYIECHFTLDREMRGPDHAWSHSPLDLRAYVRAIRETMLMLGSGIIEPTEQERVNRVNWRRVSGQQIRGIAP